MPSKTSSGLCGTYHIWGPPGTGKTTALRKLVERLLSDGYEPSSLFITSLTRAAATEIAKEILRVGITLPRGTVGTLHAACFHTLDEPELYMKHVPDWNERHPEYALGHSHHGKRSLDEPEEGDARETRGDDLLAVYNLYRAWCLPRDHWPSALVSAFADDWETWKTEIDVCDFSDLLERCLRDVERAPGDPKFILADEAQDYSELARRLLLKKWARHAEATFISADPWQALYVWAGANPRLFLDHPVPDDHRWMLRQSYRVPACVRDMALTWMQQEYSLWEPLDYQPRHDATGGPVNGEIVSLPYGSYLDPDPLLDHAEAAADAGHTVMLLAACSYQLDPLKRALRARGLPFHNPWRRKRRDWNPLHMDASRNGDAKAIGGAARLLAYKRPDREAWGDQAGPWTGRDLQAWVECVAVEGIMSRGAKEAIKALDPSIVPDLDALGEWFAAEALGAALLRNDLSWFEAHLLGSQRPLLEYPIAVYKHRGAAALKNEPKITLGTGHSVKGGESDTVIICPDISRAGYREWMGSAEDRDATVRLFYTAMTRARDTLLLARPATARHVPLVGEI